MYYGGRDLGYGAYGGLHRYGYGEYHLYSPYYSGGYALGGYHYGAYGGYRAGVYRLW